MRRLGEIVGGRSEIPDLKPPAHGPTAGLVERPFHRSRHRLVIIDVGAKEGRSAKAENSEGAGRLRARVSR